MGLSTTNIAGAKSSPGDLHTSARDEITSLISERLPYFRGVALRRLRNEADAEDALQNAFLSAWKHADRFEGRARMSTWLTAIVINSARMLVRKRSRTLHLSLDGQTQDDDTPFLIDTVPDLNPDPESEAGRRELQYRLLRLSVHLSPTLREVFRLRGIEGLSVRETAAALGLSESAVKTRDARARRELRRLDQINPAVVRAPLRSRRSRRRSRVSA